MTKESFGAIFQQGQYHREHDLLCHDRAIALQDGDLTILILADGMGSPAYRCPDIGAQFAVSYIREHAHEIHDRLGTKKFGCDLRKILQRLENDAKIFATRIGATVDDMNCTLSFAIIGPEKTVQVAIGDSPIYVKTKDELRFIYGNGDIRHVDQGTASAYDMEWAFNTIGINIERTQDLESILIMSDGCLGYAKSEELNARSETLPEWFEKVASGKVSMKKAVQDLVDAGYDDCSFAYYTK